MTPSDSSQATFAAPPGGEEVVALALVGATLEIVLAIGLLNFEVVVRVLQLRRNNIARQG